MSADNGEIEKVFLNLNTRLRKFKQEFGMEFMERVKARTPVKTGRLQRSWGFTMKQSDIEVWNVAPYAHFIENGTPYIAPRGMMKVTLLEKEEIAEIALERSKK
jgi:hypothetical protein